jgi:hypothetical protein
MPAVARGVRRERRITPDDVGKRLHDKATRGLTLSAEEQALLNEWYARHDAEEAAILRLSRERASTNSSRRGTSVKEQELCVALAQFVGAFEEVFERDWEYSRAMLSGPNIGCFIRDKATFLNPGVDDEGEDWGARAELLEQYRNLVQVMKRWGIRPQPPFAQNE